MLRELLAVAGAAVAPQLGAVLGALLGVLERGRPHEMELALSALHELGGAVEDFPLCPPGGAVEAALLAVLRLPDPPHRAVRLQAMEVLGALGGGAAALEAVLEMAADGDGEERRVLFGLCGAAAEALREGVEPMLPRLLPLLLHSLQAPPPAASPAASDSFLLFDAAEDEEGAEPMGDEEEELVAGPLAPPTGWRWAGTSWRKWRRRARGRGLWPSTAVLLLSPISALRWKRCSPYWSSHTRMYARPPMGHWGG